jgi:beta-mannanase
MNLDEIYDELVKGGDSTPARKFSPAQVAEMQQEVGSDWIVTDTGLILSKDAADMLLTPPTECV